MKKKTLLILFSAICLGIKAFAYDCVVRGIAYNLDYKSASVTYYSTTDYNGISYQGNINIPDSIIYEGVTYAVVAIESKAFINCTKLTSITIPASIRVIHDEAFTGCISLSTLHINDGTEPLHLGLKETGLKYYREGIFADCMISNLYLGRNLQYRHGESMPSIMYYYPPFFNKVPKDNKNTLRTVSLGKNVTVIPPELFYSFKNLKSIVIPDSLLAIEMGAFKETSISEIEIPNTVKSIGDAAFASCSKLTSVILPDSLNCIENYTFQDCVSLSYLKLPATIKTIGQSAFSGCKELVTEFPIGIDSIGPGALSQCSSLKKLWIPNVKNINFGLDGCKSLDSINIRGAETIYGAVFSDLPVLKYIEMPFMKDNLGMFFGASCNNSKDEFICVLQYLENGKSYSYYIPKTLEEIVVTGGCETIPYGAFYNCSMLRRLTLPSTLNGLKDKALYGCDGLKDIYVKRALPPVAYSGTFEGVNLFACTLHVPYGSKQYYEKATGWKDFYFIEEEAPVKIVVEKNIENGGEILGLSEFEYGDNVELEAIAHSGYKFVAWTENDKILTTDISYAFTAEDSRQIIAVFIPVLNSNPVQVLPEGTKVYFTWEKESEIASYKLTVYDDAAMTNVIGYQNFDADGYPLTRNLSNSISVVFTGLTEESDYCYSIEAHSESGNIHTGLIYRFFYHIVTY